MDRKKKIKIIGAICSYFAYPLYFLISPKGGGLTFIYYLLVCAGLSMLILPDVDHTKYGKIMWVCGITQVVLFLVFLHNLLAIKYNWRFTVYVFLITMSLCILALLYQLVQKRSS
jgi:hypothetical protein